MLTYAANIRPAVVCGHCQGPVEGEKERERESSLAEMAQM